MSAGLDELAAFCSAVYGDNTGTAHWAVGIGGHRNGSGKYEFESWSPREFAYPSMSGNPYRDMLAAAADSDVYLNPYLMNGTKRTKADAVTLALIHRDWDGQPSDLAACLERVAALGGFAVMSGTPGHLHVYVPLAQPVTQAAHRQLSEALADYLPPGCDKGKKAASDMLRLPGTFNQKPTINGGDPAPVVWAIPPTGVLVDPDTLARLLQVGSHPCAPPGRANAAELAPSHPDAIPAAVQAALAVVTNRSDDTMRVVGACFDAGLTLAQAREVVKGRADLAERASEFAARTPPVDDIAECWAKITDSRQERKRDRIAEQEFMAPYRDEKPSTAGGSTGKFLPLARSLATEQHDSATAGDLDNLTPATRFDVANLEGDFWTCRESLRLIFETSLARMASPWAVLGCCAARALAQVRPNATLPPLIGGPGSLNWFAAIAAKSGGGKGTANAVARQLVREFVTVRNVGSGEGIVNAYKCKPNDESPDGKRESILFNVDEVDTLTALKNRSGSTTMGTVRSAFAGEALGLAYVTRGGEHLDPHSYRLTLVVGVQPARAGDLMADADGGTPQRFQWFPGTDARITDEIGWADTSAELTLPPPTVWQYPRTIRIPPETEQFIRREQARRQRGEVDALDGHAAFVREKFAFALAVLDGRHEITSEDWRLSGIAARVSDATRAWVLAELERATESEHREMGRRRGMVNAAAEVEKTYQEQARTNRIRLWGIRKLTEAGAEGLMVSALTQMASGRDKAYLSQAINGLIETGMVTVETTERGGRLCRIVL